MTGNNQAILSFSEDVDFYAPRREHSINPFLWPTFINWLVHKCCGHVWGLRARAGPASARKAQEKGLGQERPPMAGGETLVFRWGSVLLTVTFGGGASTRRGAAPATGTAGGLSSLAKAPVRRWAHLPPHIHCTMSKMEGFWHRGLSKAVQGVR